MVGPVLPSRSSGAKPGGGCQKVAKSPCHSLPSEASLTTRCSLPTCKVAVCVPRPTSTAYTGRCPSCASVRMPGRPSWRSCGSVSLAAWKHCSCCRTAAWQGSPPSGGSSQTAPRLRQAVACCVARRGSSVSASTAAGAEGEGAAGACGLVAGLPPVAPWTDAGAASVAGVALATGAVPDTVAVAGSAACGAAGVAADRPPGGCTPGNVGACVAVDAPDDADAGSAGQLPLQYTAAAAPPSSTSPANATTAGWPRREGTAANASGPNTSSAALSTTARLTRSWPCAQAPSRARPHSRLMRRGTPRVMAWMRVMARASKGSVPV